MGQQRGPAGPWTPEFGTLAQVRATVQQGLRMQEEEEEAELAVGPLLSASATDLPGTSQLLPGDWPIAPKDTDLLSITHEKHQHK